MIIIYFTYIFILFIYCVYFRFVVHKLGKGKYIVQSIPGELSREDTSILTLASNNENGYVNLTMLKEELGYV